MTHKTIFTTAAILLSIFIVCSCNKDNAVEEQFCTLVNDQDFNGTGPLIDNFLKHHRSDSQEKSLNKLKEWLEDKSCVSAVTILCNGCVKTLPTQSELSVDFISNGQTITMTLDVLMGNPLSFRTFHN